jgi:hypothetical protein
VYTQWMYVYTQWICVLSSEVMVLPDWDVRFPSILHYQTSPYFSRLFLISANINIYQIFSYLSTNKFGKQQNKTEEISKMSFPTSFFSTYMLSTEAARSKYGLKNRPVVVRV